MVFWEEEKDAVEEGKGGTLSWAREALTSATATWRGGPAPKWKALYPSKAILNHLKPPISSYSLKRGHIHSTGFREGRRET